VVGRLRVLCCSVVAALACAAGASAGVVHPMLTPGPFVPLQSVQPSDAAFTCFNGFNCYTPQELQAAYDYPQGLGAPTGAGQTIVLVTAYGAPFAQNDLATFDAVNGLPDPPHFTVLTQQQPVSGTSGSGATYYWEVETDLDVQWAHAMAPGASIVLAVATTDDSGNIAEIEHEVLPKYPGAIVSQSFGADETGAAGDPTLPNTFSPMYLAAILRGGTILASSGDLGASNGTELEAFQVPGMTPSAMAAYPASDPFVLAVGGTMADPYPGGLLTAAGTYGGEQAWSEVDPFTGTPGAGGGAPSQIFSAPPWQRSLHAKQRLEPDVSYNAAENNGVLVVLSCRPNRADNGQTLDPTCVDSSRQGLVSVGGTSAGAPQWAAILALADELRARQHRFPLGLVAPMLYSIASDPRSYARDFHDITSGSNTLDLSAFGLGPSQFGFVAAPGYDLATGLGTPNVANLVGDLARQSNFSSFLDLFRVVVGKTHGRGWHHRFDPSR